MAVADLIVIGAGLSGCALVSRLRQQGWDGSISVVEAGRGPGGAQRHDAEGIRPSGDLTTELRACISRNRCCRAWNPCWNPCASGGILVRDAAPTVSIDAEGQLTANGAEAMPEGLVARLALHGGVIGTIAGAGRSRDV